MKFIKDVWNKYLDWIRGADKPFYKNERIWISIIVFIALAGIGEISNRNNEKQAEAERIELEQAQAKEEKEKEEQEKAEAEKLAAEQEEREKEEQKKKKQKEKEEMEEKERLEEQDKKTQKALNEWAAENPEAIIDTQVYDLIINIMLPNDFDNLNDSEKEEVIKSLGSTANNISRTEGKEEDVNVIFINTSNNELGSYKKTLLGEYKTKLK